jgi:hypothetical protein
MQFQDYYAIPRSRNRVRESHRSLVGCEMGWQIVETYMRKFYGKVKPFLCAVNPMRCESDLAKLLSWESAAQRASTLRRFAEGRLLHEAAVL